MLKAMVFAIAGAILVFLVLGMALAKEWRVDTTRTIAAPPAAIGALVADLSTWSKWSSMSADLGPQTATVISGTPRTTDQAITWSGMRGKARLVVTTATDDRIEYDVQSQGGGDLPMQQFARGRVTWQADGTGTRVQWHEERVCDSIVERWFAWFGAIQERIRQIQVGSLAGLADAVEARPAEAGR